MAEQMICDGCHKHVAAGLFCLKCGKQQSVASRVVGNQLNSSLESRVGVSKPVQVTERQDSYTSSEAAVKDLDSDVSKGRTSSLPQGVHTKESSNGISPPSSFNIAMKPASLSQNIENDQSGSSVSDSAGAEKLNEGVNKVAIQNVWQ